MYIPKQYAETDRTEIIRFMKEHAFATMVTVHEGRPVATHLPLVLHEDGETLELSGHVALGNPQWKTIEQQDVLIMFQGPHSYITSSWYEKENVPTWNYQSVHVYGTARIIQGDELKEDIASLMEKYESHRENPVRWDTLTEQDKKQINGVTGFRIRITELQAAYKLSQNRNDHDYRTITGKLKEENDPVARVLGEVMEGKRRTLYE